MRSKQAHVAPQHQEHSPILNDVDTEQHEEILQRSGRAGPKNANTCSEVEMKNEIKGDQAILMTESLPEHHEHDNRIS